MNTRNKLAGASLGALALALSHGASAQEGAPAANAPAANAGALGEVVVTAERREASLQRTPAAVTVVNAADLKKSGVADFQNVIQDVPSVVLQGQGATKNAPAVAIRGIGVDGANKQLATAIYEDGVVLNNQIGQFYDLARIEVLRGPQGTLYGGTAVGGAVNIISNDPNWTPSAEGTLELGTANLFHVTSVLNVPVSDTLAVRGAFNTYKRSSFGNPNISVQNYTNGRLKALYRPNDKFSALFGFNYVGFLVPNYDTGYVDANGNMTATLATSKGSLGQERSYKYYANFQYDLGFATLTWLPAWQHDRRNYISLGTTAPGSSPSSQSWPFYDTHSQEIRLLSKTDGRLTWTAGFYFMHRDFKRPETSGGDVVGGNPTIYTLVRHHITSEGLYGQFTYAVTDNSRITLGGRESHDYVHQTTLNTYQLTPSLNKYTIFDQNYNNFSFLVRGEHDLTSRNLLYASVSTAYRPGGLGALGTSYISETVTAYEIGSKNRFLDNRVQANLAGFFYDYPHAQVPLLVCSDYPVCATANQLGNITLSIPTQYYGAELELRAQITPRDVITFTPSYLHAEYTSDTSLVNTLLGSVGMVYTKGGTPANAPRITLAGRYDRTFDLSGGSTLVASIDAHYETSHYVAFDTSPYNHTSVAKYFTQRPYTISNVSLTYNFANGKYNVTGYVRNWANVAFKNGSGTVATARNDPRTVGIVLNARL